MFLFFSLERFFFLLQKKNKILDWPKAKAFQRKHSSLFFLWNSPKSVQIFIGSRTTIHPSKCLNYQILLIQFDAAWGLHGRLHARGDFAGNWSDPLWSSYSTQSVSTPKTMPRVTFECHSVSDAQLHRRTLWLVLLVLSRSELNRPTRIPKTVPWDEPPTSEFSVFPLTDRVRIASIRCVLILLSF